jgi:RNA polymerase sigma-70 factor (ECF subfamily)
MTKKDLDNKIIETLKSETSTQREKQKAYSELYSNYQRQIFAFLVKSTDAETAEDLKMTAFEKAYEKIGNFDSSKASFYTWLYQIASNVLIDHTRKAKFEVISLDSLAKKTMEDNSGMEFQLKSKTQNPEDIMTSDEKVKKILDAIEELDGDTKKIAKLRFIDGLSFKEITEELGMKEGSSTARVRSKRARAILEEKLLN